MNERTVSRTISSIRNPKLQQIRRLYRKRARSEEGRFVVDTPRDMERALAAGYMLDYALLCEELIDPLASIRDLLPVETCHHISAPLLSRVAYRQNPSGVLAVFHAPVAAEWGAWVAEVPVLLVMVGLRLPGNIGALLRSADALGIRAALLVDTRLDLYNPNVIRNSTGACFLRNIIPISSKAAMGHLQEAGFSLVATAVDGEHSIYDTLLPEKLAIILGEEQAGLDEFWLQAADLRLRVPMFGRAADSLNVSSCGALLMYEAMRQAEKHPRREGA